MKKLGKVLAGACAIALSLGTASVAANATAFAATEPTDAREVQPVVDLDFDDETVGTPMTSERNLYHITNEGAWDQNWAHGEIIDATADGFTGSSYKFNCNANNGYTEIGGVRMDRSTPGQSYEITMKLKFEHAEYLRVEYVANDPSADNPDAPIQGFGAAWVYPDDQNGRMGYEATNLSSFWYEPDTHNFHMFVTAGRYIDYNTGENRPGFLKFVFLNPTSGANLILDEIVVKESTVLLDEDFEHRAPEHNVESGAQFHINSANGCTGNFVEHGESGNRMIKFTGTKAAGSGVWYDWYLDRMGFLRVGDSYRFSFDYEFTGTDGIYARWHGKAEGMESVNDVMGVYISSGNVVTHGSLKDKITDLEFTADESDPRKGHVAFTFTALPSTAEFSMRQFGFVVPFFSGSENPVVYLDNLKIEKFSNEITATTTTGHGKVTAETFRPYVGKDLTVSVVPDRGYDVTSFKVDGEEKLAELSGGNYTFTDVTEPHAITVDFETRPINVRIISSPGVTVVTDKAADSYRFFERVELTVTAEAGYTIACVRVNGTDYEPEANGKYVIPSAESDLNIAVIATAPASYAMTYEANEGGTVSVSASSVAEGETATFTVTPAEGFAVKSAKYNGKTVVLNQGKFTVSDVKCDGKLTVVFAEASSVVTPGTQEPGTTEPGASGDAENEGCGGVIGMNAAIFGPLAIAGTVAVILRKKREN